MSKKTLNQTNLEALGANQLAALLIEVSTGNADIKRRLRLELSHNLGASELAHEVQKRLVSLRKSKSFVGWRKRKAFVKDLRTQLTMITDKIAPDDPNAAFDILWQFVEMAPAIFERVDDKNGEVAEVFDDAFASFTDIAPRALLDPETLADKIWTALQENHDGEWDGIIALMAPTLGAAGLARLQDNVTAFGASPIEDASDDHEAIQFLRQLRGGENHAAERRARFVKACLQEIAAVSGDTDAYIAQYSTDDLRRKDIAAEVAMLLLADGFADRALAQLLNADQNSQTPGQEAWDQAYIACLIALDRIPEAQDHRWDCFCATLNVHVLRDFLKVLPDFEDVEAEEDAKDHVLAYPSVLAALDFFLKWPDLHTAARLIETRASEILGDHASLLTPAAEALRTRHPLAASLLWRAMIDYTLGQGLSFRYDHAAEYLADCATLDAEIADYGAFPNHGDFVEGLRVRHDRKIAFWGKVR